MIYNIFPSLIHVIEISSFKKVQDEIIKYVYSEKKKNPKANVHSNRGGWQSHKEYHMDENILNVTIKNEVVDYFTNNKILKEYVELQFGSMWININGKGAYNILHIHPQCDLAGVFWIKIPKDSGSFSFDSPYFHSGWNELKSYSDEFARKMLAYPDFNFTPTEGVIMLFPSTLYHQVKTSESRQDRISASFNISLSP